MIKRLIYVLWICGLAGCAQKEALPDLRETYASQDKKPFGGYVAHRILANSFRDHSIEISRTSFKSGMRSNTDSNALYYSISSHFFSNEEEITEMLDYVYRGNTFFLAANTIDSVLLNKLYCKISENAFQNFAMPGLLQETSTSLIEEACTENDQFSYYYLPFQSYFSTLNDRYCRIIGKNGEGNTNLIVFFWGKGKFFIHTEPRAFSNYFLLTRNNSQYFKQICQLLPANASKIYWNEFYAKQYQPEKNSGFTGWSEIKKHPPLAQAALLLLSLLLLYLFFAGKRKQRIIPVQKQNVNSAVAFTETIARLYLLKKDNRSIADKMISYFHEHVRTHYFLSDFHGTEAYLVSLSKKSGVPLETTRQLYTEIALTNAPGEISDQQVLRLNDLIQEFYKNRKEWKNRFSKNSRKLASSM